MQIFHRKLRVLLLHEFRMGRRVTKETSNICSTIGNDVLSIPMTQHWINRFKNRNFKRDNSPGCEMNMYTLKQLIEEEARSITRYLVERLGCSHTVLEKRLSELGKTQKYGVWISHQLSPFQLQHRIFSYMKLL
jgi:hypothetical protein